MSGRLGSRRVWLSAGLIAAVAVLAATSVGVQLLRPEPPEGARSAAKAAAATPAPAAAERPPLVSTEAPRQGLPANHPPVRAKPRSAVDRNARQGTVEVDQTRPYTHYRVGNHSVRTIYADGSVMWLGTSGGIARFDSASRDFRTYDTRDGLAANGVYFLGKLRGKIAAGTHGGGLSVLDEATQVWSHYREPEGLAGTTVHHAIEATNGDIWVATDAGVNRVRGGALEDRIRWDRHSVASTRGGLPHDAVYGLAQGKDGAFWFATEGGLARLRDGQWVNWPGASDSDAVIALEVGRNGAVWAGSRGAGLLRVRGGAKTTFTTEDGLPSGHVSSLHFDRKERLWVGTRNGLALFSGGKFELMSTAQGLIAEGVHAVTTTADGDLWVGGFGGVAQIRSAAAN